MQMKNAKAPADFIFSEPFVAVKTPTTISIAAGAPHPHAAALFVDFLLSKAGQDLMAGQGRWVSRKDGNYFADLKGKKMRDTVGGMGRKASGADQALQRDIWPELAESRLLMAEPEQRMDKSREIF